MICGNVELCYDSLKKGITDLKCVNKREDCIRYSDERSNAKCEENGKIYNLVNTPKYTITLYRVDGGIIVTDKNVPEGTEKCDFMYCINAKSEDSDLILVELKGVDVRKAMKQLYGTWMLYKDFIERFKHLYCRAIVTRSTPNIKADPNYVKLFKVVSASNGNVRIVERSYSENYENLSEIS